MNVSYSYNIGTSLITDMGAKVHRDKRIGDIDKGMIENLATSLRCLAIQHFPMGIEFTE